MKYWIVLQTFSTQMKCYFKVSIKIFSTEKLYTYPHQSMTNFINRENEFLSLSREISGLRPHISFNVFKIIFSDFYNFFSWVRIWKISGNSGIWLLSAANDVGSHEDYTCGTSAPSSTTVYTDLRRSATDFAKIKTIFMRHVFILWQSLLQVTSVNVFFSHFVWFLLGLQRLFKTILFVQMAWIFRNNVHSFMKKNAFKYFAK